MIKSPQIIRFFSHHPLHEWDRCIKIKIQNYEIILCTRCTGAVVGSIAYLIGWILGFFQNISFVQLFLFPLISFFDWSAYKLGLRKGNNYIRGLGGIFIGMSFLTYARGILSVDQTSFWGIIFYAIIFIIVQYLSPKDLYSFYEKLS
jgi:uncharacterized membrane protein